MVLSMCYFTYEARVRLRRPSQDNHNDVLVSRSHRANDVTGITHERRRECLYNNRTAMFVSHLAHTRNT